MNIIQKAQHGIKTHAVPLFLVFLKSEYSFKHISVKNNF